jgi:hypothetical protein
MKNDQVGATIGGGGSRKYILDALLDLQDDEALLYLDAQDVHTDECFDFAKAMADRQPYPPATKTSTTTSPTPRAIATP